MDKFDFEERLRKLLSEYEMEFPTRADNCDIAFDMWRKITRKDDFKMGTEPVIDVVELILKHQDEILNVPNEKQLELDI